MTWANKTSNYYNQDEQHRKTTVGHRADQVQEMTEDQKNTMMSRRYNQIRRYNQMITRRYNQMMTRCHNLITTRLSEQTTL